MKPIIVSIAAIAMTIFLQPFAASADGSAQKNTAGITGHITDSKTGSHIPYVTIELKGTTIAVFADNTGHYTLNDLPEGEFTLQATKVGHGIAEQKVKISKGESLEVNFEMQEEAVTMKDVVVTATRNETDKSKSPTIVNVLSEKNFERTAAATLSETLNFGAGLRMEFNCSNCGVPQLRINGLDGQYSQVLLDSRPIFSSLATVYGLEQIPTAMVERVEVIRGGGSALFGSNAIGGVVNIITKEPMRNSVTLSNTTGFLDSKTSDMTTSLGGSFISDDRKAGVYIFGMIRDRNAYQRDDDGFSEIPELGSETLGFRGYYKTGTYSRITAEYHHIREFRRGGNNLDRPPHEADVAEQLRHEINGGGVRFDGYAPNQRHRFSVYGSGQVIDRNSYFGTGKNLDAYGTTLDRTLVGGGQYTYSFHRLFFSPSQLTAGMEYNQDELNDRMLGYDRHIDQKTRTFGGFLQNEWQSNEFNFVIGARLDKNNLIERVILSPRASLRYTPNEHIGLRGSYSSGYRAPQVYNEDLHVAAVGGEVALIELAEGLRPEYSHSFSASADLYETFGDFQANLLIEGFYTRLKNVFILSEIGRDNLGNLLLERRNGTGATVRGINLEAMLGLPGKMELQMGYTLQRSIYNEPEVWSQDPAVPAQRRMFRSPDNYGYMTANVYITSAFKASLFGTYTGKMDVPHYAGYIEKDVVAVSPRFFDMGLRTSYQISLGRSGKMEFSLGVKNILDHFQRDIDQGLLRDAGYIYGPALPRTIFFGVKLTI